MKLKICDDKIQILGKFAITLDSLSMTIRNCGKEMWRFGETLEKYDTWRSKEFRLKNPLKRKK